MSKKILCWCFLLSLISAIHLKSQSVAYYSSIALRESPFAPFQGIVPLTEKEAANRNHYRFYYDEKFRLVRLGFYLGDQLRDPNHTANYFFTNSEIKITYRDNKEIRTFFDRFGNPAKDRGAAQVIILKDALGKNQMLYFEDEKGNRIENNWGIAVYQWEILNDGSVIENRYDLKGKEVSLRPGFEFYRIRLCFEANGLLALMQNIDKDGNLLENNSGVAQDKLHFDQVGRWLGWTVLDAQHRIKKGNGPNVAKGINQTDQYGYERGISYEGENGEKVINRYGFWGSKRFYDQFGNYDYTQFTNAKEEPGINEKTGYSKAKYSWSKDGLRRLSVQLLDVNDQAVLHKTRGYSKVAQKYDQKGRLIKISYYDTNGVLVNRSDNGVAYICLKYDNKGNRIERKNYDKKGKVLK